jgi:hypothetical protein
MNAKKTAVGGSLEIKMNPLNLLKDKALIKDALVFSGWIAALLALASFSWIFTQPIRTHFLIKSVNQTLEKIGDLRRLEVSLNTGGSLIEGSWFKLAEESGSGGSVFLFSFIGEGTFFPCVAFINREGKVEEFVPLDRHGQRVLKRISPGIIKIYARRIEEAAS